MDWLKSAIADIKIAEGLKLESYQDAGGVWTVGYGHTGPGVIPGLIVTQAWADTMLNSDAANAEQDLDRNLGWFLLSPDNIKRGLVNMCFNLGWPRLSKFRNMLNCGEVNDWFGMAHNAMDSDWARELPSRAAFVCSLFNQAGSEL